jgi:UDP-N-acetylglucosamine--N-acetylmuramyl-(pentapeptide) pyrophosphoryl-undecaprenol N-acetylglucosamine transferase
MKINTICFVAGKSGGHIIPCIALARHAKLANPETHTLFFSTTASIDRTIIESSPFIDRHIALPLTYTRSINLIKLVITLKQFGHSFIRSLRILRKYRPIKIVTTGGFIAIPVCLAGYVLRIPLEIYELNVTPGTATRFLAPFAHTINICFNKSNTHFKHKAQVTDYPVRFSPEERIDRTTASLQLGLNPQLKTILILGGSQGSYSINDIIKKIVEHDESMRMHMQIIHQTGNDTRIAWAEWYAQQKIQALTFPYHHQMAAYYCAADLIISRAGAGGIFESLFFNKPCILIPLETQTNNHQLLNAQEAIIQWQRLFILLRQKNIETNSRQLMNEIYHQLSAANSSSSSDLAIRANRFSTKQE